jgi:hypothetical protein
LPGTRAFVRKMSDDRDWEFTRYACTLATLRDNLDQYGVAILPRVLNEAECDAMMAGMWQTLAHWTQHWDAPIARKKTSTWRGYQDLFPTRHMLMQHYGLGHAQFIWELRQNPKIVDVFAAL